MGMIFLMFGIVLVGIMISSFPKFAITVLAPGVFIMVALFVFDSREILFGTGGDGWIGLGRFITWCFVFFGCAIGIGIISLARLSIKARKNGYNRKNYHKYDNDDGYDK
ncbi:hypothetical protein [Neisseria sp. Ec49-e6-T10]|uniref:hypothetical protein n=1 Tax=Neisseria sp. Ec49-e6-T10 TaxID=3140744 RepID=UPI003EBA89FA